MFNKHLERLIWKFNILIIRKWKETEEGFKKWVHAFYVRNKQKKPFQFSRKDNLGSSNVQLPVVEDSESPECWIPALSSESFEWSHVPLNSHCLDTPLCQDRYCTCCQWAAPTGMQSSQWGERALGWLCTTKAAAWLQASEGQVL